ncbi:MAG: peptide deformylase [Peptoniphilaceae bacterium]|nr:peptide deformylase [Peptoniphilaceae bacterium]MDD7382843.1 peptide deformylase [Peptoniphilaceae bacterium]MDY3738198.1 peptide deformylase [Peptoniphilaceae bacterium]
MAIREVRTLGDDILRKKSRSVDKIDDKVRELLDDMAQTMYEDEGIGISAVQVGILKRIIVVDVGDGLYKMINPEIIEKDGEEVDVEGCLSVPDFNATVKRPKHIKVKYKDENGDEKILEAYDLKARCICHEIDHLDGILFVDKYIQEVRYNKK